MSALESLLAAKQVGNDAYKVKDYEAAIKGYGPAVKLMPRLPEDDDSDDDERKELEAGVSAADPDLLKQGAVVLCNRAASYMALNKPIPALADAQLAGRYDTSNWKAHWRTGLALMMMKPRLERSEQAIAAFERVLALGDKVPAADQTNAREALNRARYRLEQGKDAVRSTNNKPAEQLEESARLMRPPCPPTGERLTSLRPCTPPACRSWICPTCPIVYSHDAAYARPSMSRHCGKFNGKRPRTSATEHNRTATRGTPPARRPRSRHLWIFPHLHCLWRRWTGKSCTCRAVWRRSRRRRAFIRKITAVRYEIRTVYPWPCAVQRFV
jgi:hypothetical protein